MAGIVSNIIQNSLAGFVSGAVTTAGEYAGSAVNGVGNLIENGGKAIGDGRIAGSFRSVGDGINSYGTSIRNATAPNSGGGGYKSIDPKSLPASKGGEKKATSTSGEKKALPTSKPMKQLPAPPAKKDAAPKPKSTYTPPVAVKKQEGNKTANGKVVPQRSALPTNSAIKTSPSAPASVVGKPSYSGTKSASSTPQPYPVKSTPNPPSKYPGASGAPSKAASVVGGGQPKNLAIPGFGLPGAAAGKATTPASIKAPSVINGGSKSVSKPVPGKAQSVAGSYAKGGPSFF